MEISAREFFQEDHISRLELAYLALANTVSEKEYQRVYDDVMHLRREFEKQIALANAERK